MAPIHLQPTAELAERVLAPGDPGRALRLAQHLIEGPRMFNHHRGLWGYSGPARLDGAALTIQSTGMGGPSAVIVASELIELGARTIVRVGTCGVIAGDPGPGLELGRIVAVDEALCADGTSRALGAGERARPEPGLAARLAGRADTTVTAVTSDLFYDTPAETEAEWVRAGAAVVEMETAALFTLAARRGVAAGALLAISDIVLGGRERITADALASAELQLGERALAAVTDA